LRERVSGARRSGRHRWPYHTETHLASDLLDIVVLVDKIGTPGGWHQTQPLAARAFARSGNPDPGRPQHLDYLLSADRRAQDTGGQVGTDALGGHRRRLTDHRVGVGDRTAAEFGHQSGRHPGSGQRQRRIDATREASGRLRRQLVPTESASNGHRVETRRLKDNVAGGRCQLGGLPAHHAGQADRPSVIGDQQVVGRQLPVDIIEGGQSLSLRGLPDHDRPPKPVTVVGVQRLPRLQHHVIGDVNFKADRTHPGSHQPSRHPSGRGGVRVDIVDRQRNEDRAVLRLQPDRVATLGGAHIADQVGVGEGHPKRLSGFTSDAAHAQAVPDIGGDIDLQDLVAGL